MPPIVVTGCAGFIGAQVAQILLDAGRQVIGIDNLNAAYDPRLKFWRLEQLRKHANLRFIEADISRREEIERVFEGIETPEAIVNLAARAGVRQSVQDPWVYVDTNATGTLNLLDHCRRRGIRKFVLASTSSLYGAHNRMPYREDADTSRPLSPYAASKKAAEALCHSYHHLHGIDVTILRYFTVYGPAGRPDMSVFRFVQWVAEGRPVVVYGDGRQSRDFTYVEDVARGTVACLPLRGYQTINLGSDKPVELIEILRLVERLTGRQALIETRAFHSADVPATWADITQARQLLGWQPQTTYQQGIAQAVDWYMNNRSWASQIDTADIPRVLEAAAGQA